VRKYIKTDNAKSAIPEYKIKVWESWIRFTPAKVNSKPATAARDTNKTFLNPPKVFLSATLKLSIYI